jgi:hypothetical protein
MNARELNGSQYFRHDIIYLMLFKFRILQKTATAKVAISNTSGTKALQDIIFWQILERYTSHIF